MTALLGLLAVAWTQVVTNTVVEIPLDRATGIEFVLGATAQPCVLTRVWEGVKPEDTPLRAQAERLYRSETAYPDAFVDLWPWWDGGRCHVRPSLRPYVESGNRILPRGQELLAKWDSLEHPTNHVFRLAFTPADTGNVRAWVDGSYVQRMDNFHVKTAALRRLAFTFRPGARYRLTPCRIDLSKDALRLDFPTPEPVAKCHYVAGNSAFECESYQSRSPMDAYPNAIHRRLPAADWHLARIRFALDDDPALERVLTVRLCCNEPNGSGGNLVSDVDLDFTKGLPADVRTVGTVAWKGRPTTLYECDVALDIGPLADLVGWKDYLDFEFLGRKRTEAEGPDRRMKPAHDRSSAFVICGVTLLKAPFSAVIRPLVASPGNVFTADERVKRTSVTLTAWRDCAGEVACPYDSFRYTLKRGETRRFELDLSSVRDEGLYDLPIRFLDRRGKAYFTHPARMAVVPEAGRRVDPRRSSYGTWWMNWGERGRFDVGAPLCRKAGIPKVTVTQGDLKARMEAQGLLSCGNVMIFGPGHFDYETGRFRPRDGKDGETVAVEDLKRQLAATTFADHVLVWHESAEVCPEIPEELTGRPIPAATDWNRKRARYLDECVRILRRHFPDLRIQIGNTGISLGAVVSPLRGGADPASYRGVTIGNEAFGGDCPPERLTTGNIQGMALVKATARKMLGFDVPMDGCWEATCRRSRSLGEARQAAYLVRDALVGLANGYRLTMLGGLIDCHNGYYDSAWGSGALCARMPTCYPKRVYLECARLTKALDGATEPQEVETGDPSVHGWSFRRADGRFVAAFWTQRGRFAVRLGGGETLSGGEMPVYHVSDRRLLRVSASVCADPAAAARAAAATVVARLDGTEGIAVAPSEAFRTPKWNRLPVLVPGVFRVAAVSDESRGACLEVRLDTSTTNAPCDFLTEYTTLTFRKPVALPGAPKGIGLWVKGNANGGQVRFEIEDGKGRVFRTFDYGNTAYEGMDVEGRLCVDFTGWLHVAFGIDGKNWYTLSGDKSAPVPPYKVRALTIGMNRRRCGIVGFRPVSDTLRIQALGAVE